MGAADVRLWRLGRREPFASKQLAGSSRIDLPSS